MAFAEKELVELVQIAQAGGSLEVDARNYTADDLLALARALQPDCELTLRNCEVKSAKDLAAIVAGAPGRVTIS